ncbi:hypothetical protein LHJ74_17045 [Streptomyces sp. N2-109]|uniref:Uncharacterized protein n=1 Tax=Streptomyces gossypii TaxID=2883101 RepID=A0ABT2JUL4_9ACTN|nr:GTPase-associated protein 1-related protein [Streptomyces gossypii]MCT2591584.1 hypothetical protein [Streptomyces gossypii]
MTGDGSAPPRLPEDGAQFQQLYYTSCERGLSGFSGFQFNAVSTGVAAETMHTVEALAGYDPPRSLVESDTPDQLARCPVNLCYVPLGKGATALCVQYVGRDSARRFGNYFAHALHTDDFGAASSGMLGIELWGSPVWTSTVAPDTEIPVLQSAPPRGPLNPRTVQAFLRGHPHADQLTQLLAAVLAALTEEDQPSVVLVDSSTDRIAHWFAAVCYLLPPPLARQLSFSTYLFRPGLSRLHLIGTVPEAEAGFGPDDEGSYLVFDFAEGDFPSLVYTHYLVRLLVRIGVGSIRSVWAWTRDYTHGHERDPGDWHAPVAAAATEGGVALDGVDVEAVIEWLGRADHLGPLRAKVARGIDESHQTLDDGALAKLSAAALAGGAPDLHQRLEGRLHASRMRAYMTGAGDAVEPVPVTDPEQREHATAHWRRLLGQAEDVRQGVRLLLWADRAGLDPPKPLLADQAGQLARELLSSASTRSAGAGFRREVEHLLARLPEFRSALVEGLAELVARRGGQEQLFSQFPSHLLDERDLEDRPRLLEHYWMAQAERKPGRTVELLFKILAVRGQETPDADLLRALWRKPLWPHRDAVEIAERLPTDRVLAPAVDEWFDGAVKQPIADEQGLKDCLLLCELLDSPGRYAWLRPVTQECVTATLTLDGLLRDAPDATSLARGFAIPATETWAPPRALKQFRLVNALLERPAQVHHIPAMVVGFGDRTRGAYLSALQRLTVRRHTIDDVLLSHVAGVTLVSSLGPLPQAHADIRAAILAHALDNWRSRDTRRLAQLVRPYAPLLAERIFEHGEQRLSSYGKFVRRITGRGPRDGDRDDYRGTGPDTRR